MNLYWCNSLTNFIFCNCQHRSSGKSLRSLIFDFQSLLRNKVAVQHAMYCAIKYYGGLTRGQRSSNASYHSTPLGERKQLSAGASRVRMPPRNQALRIPTGGHEGRTRNERRTEPAPQKSASASRRPRCRPAPRLPPSPLRPGVADHVAGGCVADHPRPPTSPARSGESVAPCTVAATTRRE